MRFARRSIDRRVAAGSRSACSWPWHAWSPRDGPRTSRHPNRSATQVTLRTGESWGATLVDVVDQDEFVFAQDSQRRSVKFDDLVSWGSYADRSQGTHLVMADGSLLVADVLGIEQDAVVVVGRLWQETRLPRAAVRAILFHVPGDLSRRDELYWRAVANDRQESRLLLENGDELTGQLPDVVPREAGAFQLTRITWIGEDSKQSVEVPLDRVIAVLLTAGTQDAPLKSVNTVVVGLRDGSLIRANHATRRTPTGIPAGGRAPHIYGVLRCRDR